MTQAQEEKALQLKLNVKQLIKLGLDHPAIHVRYKDWIALLRERATRHMSDWATGRAICQVKPIDLALLSIERWYRTERKAFQIASVLSCSNSNSLDTLAELRLVLRLARRKLTNQQFQTLVGKLFKH